MARPDNKNCNECNAYEAIDGSTGKCKKAKAERHMSLQSVGVESSTSVVNGWPVVDGNGTACGDFE